MGRGGAGEKPRRGVGFWLGQLGGELQLLLKCRSPRRNGSAMGDVGISALAAFRTGMLHPRGWPMGALTPREGGPKCDCGSVTCRRP